MLPPFFKNGKHDSFSCNTGFCRLAEEPLQAPFMSETPCFCQVNTSSLTASSRVFSVPGPCPRFTHLLTGYRELACFPLFSKNGQHLRFTLASLFLLAQKSTLFLLKDPLARQTSYAGGRIRDCKNNCNKYRDYKSN